MTFWEILKLMAIGLLATGAAVLVMPSKKRRSNRRYKLPDDPAKSAVYSPKQFRRPHD
jgi:hypothetical protein